MIPAIIHSLPKYHERIDLFEGWRVCHAKVPGLVVIHKDLETANKLVTIAVNALIEENQDETVS